MSTHYSKFDLNTYCGTPYFLAHIPASYPLRQVMEKCRAFRRMPPRLRELAVLSKKWAHNQSPGDDFGGIDSWYDSGGHELNPWTGQRLTDAEIDGEWSRWPEPSITVKDIPVPPSGFADPDTWEEPAPEPSDDTGDDAPSQTQVLMDIHSRGREAAAKEYGVPADQLAGIKTDGQLVNVILGRNRG